MRAGVGPGVQLQEVGVGLVGGGATALCVVQALVPDAEDAWGYVLERTRTPADPELLPTVDILVPSYNEEADLLRVTLTAATHVAACSAA